MGLIELLDFGINKISVEKKIEKAVQQIRDESGLVERDWYEFAEQTWGYPVEAQIEIPSTLDEKIAIYEKDLEDIQAVIDETRQYVDKYAPEIKFDVFQAFDDKIIELNTCMPIYRIDANGNQTYDMNCMNNKLVQAQGYLYGTQSGADIQEDAQIVYNNFENLYEETSGNLGKTIKGVAGEEHVCKALARQKGNYTYLENIVIPAYEEKGKTSETDIYIISSKGIFVCEVKNYGRQGDTLHLYDEGMWTITNEYGAVIQKKGNAFYQNRRHCNATKSFIKEHLGIEVPIIPVFISGNDYVELDVHSNEIVIRASEINDMVSKFNDVIDSETQKKIVQAFEDNKLDINKFGAKVNADRARYISELFKEYLPYLKANAKIADTCQELSVSTKKIIYPIIAALIVLTMIPLVALGEWIAVAFGVISWGAALFFPGKLSGFLGFVSVVCVALWGITMIHPLAIISILSLVVEYYMAKKKFDF